MSDDYWYTGRVSFYEERPDASAFGFIEPDGISSARENNIYFSEFSLKGAPVQVGDRVKYWLREDHVPKPGNGPQAKSVEVIGGENQ